MDCHDSDSKEGGLDFSTIDFDLHNSDSSLIWVKVYDRVRDGEMPPKDASRPLQDQTKKFLMALDAKLSDANVQIQASEGRALARRLNRDEYQNSLRNLLGVEKDYRPLLPEDGRSLGFDKVGSALSVLAEHLQAYMTATPEALNEAIVTGPSPKLEAMRYSQRGPLTTYVYLGPVVDASGQMRNGESFANYMEFRSSLLADPDQLARSLTQHLVTYATGTGPQYADRNVIHQIVDRIREHEYGFRSLIHEIIQSPIFLNQ